MVLIDNNQINEAMITSTVEPDTLSKKFCCSTESHGRKLFIV
jgi:hypothetical protein